MPEEQAKIVKEIPRDTQTNQAVQKFAATGPPADEIEKITVHSPGSAPVRPS